MWSSRVDGTITNVLILGTLVVEEVVCLSNHVSDRGFRCHVHRQWELFMMS